MGLAVKDPDFGPPSADLDDVELMSLRLVENWTKRARRAKALRGIDLRDGLWPALRTSTTAPVIATKSRTPADMAWWRLVQLCTFCAAAGHLAELAVIIHAAEAGLPRDRRRLEAVRRGLAAVAAYVARARTPARWW